MYYGARFYDGALGRFIQPDTIVPEPGDPQALNRYSYVLNNPLRYTDPTGMFSEDEIMRYLGVSTWDDVLAMFGEGGVMAGAWGFLEVLQQAELGDPISMWMDALNSTQSLPFLVGTFSEQDGQLIFVGTMQIGDNTWQATMGVVAFASLSGNGNPTRFWVQGATANAYVYNTKYGHLKFDASRVDWVGVGLDGLGIVTDVLTVGAGGRAVNGVQVAKTARSVGQISDAASFTISGAALAVDLKDGADSWGMWADFGLDAAGLYLPVVPDAISLVWGVPQGFYITPWGWFRLSEN